MNKTYFTPECKVIKIETVSILAASNPPEYGGAGGGNSDAPFIEFDDFE
jgi:hypothetical protein